MLQGSLIGRMRRTLIGDRAFYERVVTIALPIIIQNTISNVVSLLDNVMVGRVGTLEMSAVSIVNQLLFVFYLCIFGGLAGAGIFSTQYAGARDNEGVRYCFRIKWLIAAAMLLCSFAVFLIFPKNLIGLYLAEGTNPDDLQKTLGFGLDYLFVMLYGLIPFAVSQIYASTLREVGETRVPMIASISAILVNLVFNYLLIFGKFGFPQLGVVGAAAATVLSRYVEMLIIVVYTHAKHALYPFIKGAYASVYIPLKLLRDVFKRGMPLLVNEFFWSSGMAVLLQCYSVRGLDVVAACNIASTVSNLFKVVFLSMGDAVAIMVGQALGANRTDEAKDIAWKLMAASVASNLVMGTMLFALSSVIPQIYNTEASVRHMAMEMLWVVAATMPFYSIAHCCYFTLRSGGKTIITFIFDSGFTWGICVPFAWILANLTGLPIVPLYLAVQSRRKKEGKTVLELRLMNEAEIRTLYAESLSRDFPPSELKALSSIMNMYHKGRYDVLGAYQNNLLAGYALLYCPREERFLLLDYLAVEPQYRHQGIGTMLLRQLRDYYAARADALLNECEHPAAAPDELEARNRIHFYTQTGAMLTSVQIWLFDVEYSIMVLPCTQVMPECDWAAKMIEFYQQMLPEEMFKRNVRLIHA